jgi:hypothetical protein
MRDRPSHMSGDELEAWFKRGLLNPKLNRCDWPPEWAAAIAYEAREIRRRADQLRADRLARQRNFSTGGNVIPFPKR